MFRKVGAQKAVGWHSQSPQRIKMLNKNFIFSKTIFQNLRWNKDFSREIKIFPFWKTVQQFLKKLNKVLPYDLVIPLLQKHASTWNFYTDVLVSLFIIVQRWKQPKYSSIDKWINKMWSVHTMEYYLSKKKLLIHATTWMNIENIMSNKRS